MERGSDCVGLGVSRAAARATVIPSVSKQLQWSETLGGFSDSEALRGNSALTDLQREERVFVSLQTFTLSTDVNL